MRDRERQWGERGRGNEWDRERKEREGEDGKREGRSGIHVQVLPPVWKDGGGAKLTCIV